MGLRNVWSEMDMVHLTQVANYSYNVSWLKEYELGVLRVGCVFDFTKDILIE